MPRLAEFGVLAAAISDGAAQINWEQDTFAFADAHDESTGRYRGLKAGEHVDVGMSQTALIVKPERAQLQLEEESTAEPEDADDGEQGDGSQPPGSTEPAVPTRFYGRKQLDPVRAIRDFGDLINEVASQLGDAEGGKVTITVEINAESDGFDDRTRRTVSENAAQLGFESHEFEE